MPGKKKPARDSSIPECEDGQLFGRVTKLLGNYRLMVYCNDDQERMGLIRGALRKKVWIAVGDIVLVSLRECVSADDKADICDRLDPKLVYKLKKIDPTINPKLFLDHESKNMKGESIHEKEESTGFEFGDEEQKTGGAVAASESFNFDDI
jgi:initiation factor 1A